MVKPGVYRIPMSEYLAIPAVNASMLRALVTQCPAAAWYASWLNPEPPPPDDTDGSDAGTIGHALLLEGRDDLVEEINPHLYPTKSSGAIPTGFTNKEIKAARDLARANGRIPILSDKYAVVKAMVASARSYIEATRDAEPVIWNMFQPNGGESELTIVFEVDGVLCKIRPDRINATHTAVVDAKFSGVSAEPNSYGRTQLLRMGQYISAAFYRLGLGGHDGISYTFLVIENTMPHLASLVGVSPQLFDLGMRKIEWALTRWKQCVATGRFPAYSAQIAYPDVPPWVEAEWLERETNDALVNGIAYGSQA